MKAFWNIFFSLFFALLVLIGIRYLAVNGLIILTVPAFDFIVLALAIFRLVRLFSYDIITQFIRDWFKDAPEGTLSGTVGALLSCPWCTGLWFSFFVVFVYYATPYAWPVLLMLALAGIASHVQIVSNWVGWNAEYRKRVVTGSSGSGTCG